MRFTPLLNLVLSFATCPAFSSNLGNGVYTLTCRSDKAVEVSVKGVAAQHLAATFVVMYSERNPGFGGNRVGRFDRSLPVPFPAVPSAPRAAQRWSFYSNDAKTPRGEVDSLGATDDIELSVNSRGERIFHYHDSNGNLIEKKEGLEIRGTVDPYLAGEKTVLHAIASSNDGNSIHWEFAPQPNFTITASVLLPPNGQDPEIRYELKIRRSGYYSVAYTGAPSINVAELVSVPQETIDLQRKAWNYVMSEAHVSLPRVHLATATMNSALVVDPAESPFRLVEDSKAVWTYSLAAESNSRFGLMVEANAGQAHPVAFTPIMGGPESRMNSGDTYRFTLRYVLRAGPWRETFKYIARNIYRFRDMRDNTGTGPLYHTIENLIDYLGERDVKNYCMWHAEQKYYNYWSDQAGVFKPFSPLFSLSAAIVTDDEAFYRTRALPMVEFALSRRTNVFAPYDVFSTGMVNKMESPLGGPYVDTGQLYALGGMFQNRTYAFPFYASLREPGKNSCMSALALYRASGRKLHLDEAEQQADLSGGRFMDLLELYEETGKPKYLDASLASAYRYVASQNLFPAVPDENITVDEGNMAPIHGHAYQRHEDWGFARPQPLPVSQQTVPAWRVSLIGTVLDAYRGGYWLNNHAQLMRIATYANDEFLRDLQRWAMVGRFGNYAGDFRSNRHSLVAELPDAPMHYIYETNYSTFNPGHANEWLGAAIDFLVSDLFNRSARNIDFPSRCMYESGFRVKVYGDRPGRFYDEKGIQLWLPRHLLEADNRQIEYLAGHGNGKLYLAFWNQSFRTERVNVLLNRALVNCGGIHRARRWIDNGEMGNVDIADNAIQFDIPPKGIIAYAIPDVAVTTGLQAKLAAPDAIKLGRDSLVTRDAPFGHVTGMLLTLGKGLTNSFVYTDAPAANVIAAKLRFRQGDAPWSEQTDAIYPYEFSNVIDESKGMFECILEIQTADGQQQHSEPLVLRWEY